MITPEKNLRKYSQEFQKIENYEEAVKSTELYDLHHRKGIETLEDGTVMIRSMKELQDLGLYWNRPPEELIFIRYSEHISMHQKVRTGKKNSMYGKKHSDETKAKMSELKIGEKNPNFGRTGDKSPSWKGDLVTDKGKRRRIRDQKRREALSNSLT